MILCDIIRYKSEIMETALPYPYECYEHHICQRISDTCLAGVPLFVSARCMLDHLFSVYSLKYKHGNNMIHILEVSCVEAVAPSPIADRLSHDTMLEESPSH